MIPTFRFSRIPDVHFGAGTFSRLADLIARRGGNVLLVTGKRSLEVGGRKDMLLDALREKGVTVFHVSVTGEPTPELVDETAARYRGFGIEVVCAVGGGSVIDAGKAVSAMLPKEGDSVSDYLEGVGTETHDGVKVPFIAAPTTAGTGSEATKNAVLSRVGPRGFKKSLRHDNLVPDTAVIDPELTLSCPEPVTTASGMDAFCQLLEAYVSVKATPMTDALALSGLEYASRNLLPACTDGAGDLHVRTGMSYAALLSGVALANAGLGIVHGLASAIGGLFDIPHGVICGTLLAPAVRTTIERLRGLGEEGDLFLEKYARVGATVTGGGGRGTAWCCDALAAELERWAELLDLPFLGDYGVSEADVENILDGTANKNNPVELGREDIRRIVEARL